MFFPPFPAIILYNSYNFEFVYDSHTNLKEYRSIVYLRGPKEDGLL